jgi:hypothetical protein
LSIGEVAKDLRKEAERRSILHVNQKGSKITRGVFGPTFAEEKQLPEPTDIQKPTKEPDTLPQGQDKHGKRKAEHTTSSRRKRVATSRDTEATCRVCDGNHVLAQCYYVFPKTAPEYFKERKIIREAVEHRLRSDTSLKEEINRLKKVGHIEETE